MTTPAIVSFGMGGWYPQGIQRLRQSCEPYNVQFMGYTHYPPFCPNHKELPYAFKVYCMHAVSVTNPVMLWLGFIGMADTRSCTYLRSYP
jgi:hypothetical protein